ncbi:RepB family plasmid replication initiator protein [Paenimyroides tangerinum]|jgi:plasmid replication initiation protein|uniref:RepB family plasmid replication initiator protein n=1 Tax=Paenimyroides tangerinum TaxID=2488728 RepID=A0A3P3VWF8_9FLAO|nr:replication initiation protein [Paenimyroides tangerinum]RRJ86677.1 RepB family plasmid replication initiator protein [Paenimyroides tangerinum]
MRVNNKDLIQSYIITSAKYDYSVYEKRILYRLIELFQHLTKGEKLNEKINVAKDLFDVSIVTMPISMFLNGEEDKNHSRVKSALSSLAKKFFEYEDDRTWELISVISEPKIDKYEENTTFRINSKIVGAFLDFSKGFSKYELVTAMKFESVYSMRFYELLSGQKKPISYSIDKLKIMFKIEDKYQDRPSDFIKYVVTPAKKELDKSAPYSFEYIPIKQGRKIVSIKFYPVYQPSNRDGSIEAKKLQKSTSLRFDLDKIIIDYLKQNYVFSEEEIQNNRELFISAVNSKDFDLLYFLSEQRVNASTKKNPKGWIINSIKKQLAQLE